MLIRNVQRRDHYWEVIGRMGEVLRLPAASSGPFEIGVLGTRRRKKISNVTRRFGELISSLARPVYVIDVRRDGVGAQGSWSPRELASVIPDIVARLSDGAYAYEHLPALAPSIELLADYRDAVKSDRDPEVNIVDVARRAANGEEIPDVAVWRHWQVFRARYLRELSTDAVLCARAFVEAAQVVGGLPVFLCAEPQVDEFDDMTQSDQDEVYCHRFTLAAAIRRSLEEAFPDTNVTRVGLVLG